jgi:hypothetical protein
MKAAAQDVCNKVETVVHYYERLDTALQKAIESLPEAMRRVNENFVRDVLEEARRGGVGPKKRVPIPEIPVLPEYGGPADQPRKGVWVPGAKTPDAPEPPPGEGLRGTRAQPELRTETGGVPQDHRQQDEGRVKKQSGWLRRKLRGAADWFKGK